MCRRQQWRKHRQCLTAVSAIQSQGQTQPPPSQQQAQAQVQSQPSSPVADASRSSSDAATDSLDGSDVPYDLNDWQPGAVHTVHSPKEFKAFVMQHSKAHPVMLMCKAKGCRPCKVFSRTYARQAEEHPDIVCLDVIGDESKALRRMMVLLDVKMTPSFFCYSNTEQIHAHSGNSDEKLEQAFTAAMDALKGASGGGDESKQDSSGSGATAENAQSEGGSKTS